MVPQKGNPMESYQLVCVECGQTFFGRSPSDAVCGVCRKYG